MMDNLVSTWPASLFGLPQMMEDGQDVYSILSSMMLMEENGRKRPRVRQGSLRSRSRRSTKFSTKACPDTHSTAAAPPDEDEIRPAKRFCGAERRPLAPPVQEAKAKEGQKRQSHLARLPEDVLTNCLSFLSSVEDRYALQCTSKQFRRISNRDEMMIGIEVGGDRSTGVNGIIQETDTPEAASDKLTPFAIAGNLEAIYMLGIIKSYCFQDVESGIVLLKMASAQGYVRASYALGLVLRDARPSEAEKYMKMAADAKYLPALQELLPAREMKAKYGEPKAEELRRHLDHLCLSRLLSRHYVRSPDLMQLSTSHCWNPLCGRWAFKATVGANGVAVTLRRPWGVAFYRQGQRSTDSDTENTELSGTSQTQSLDFRVSRMKMCSRCCRAKYCSKLCQVYDWRSGRHKMECQFL